MTVQQQSFTTYQGSGCSWRQPHHAHPIHARCNPYKQVELPKFRTPEARSLRSVSMQLPHRGCCVTVGAAFSHRVTC
eukprot:764343-Hanusia_phi.AAC.2